jgi:hypothetical protein
MEMVYGGMASMLLGYLAGRALKLSDVGVIVVITMAGAGSLLTGLAYLWLADIQYADWFVDLCKRNGLL